MKRTIWILAIGIPAVAQTKVDLRTQSKTVDFTSADYTKPFRSGTVLPATCSQGETFLLLNGPANGNFYACITPNSWSAQAGTQYSAGSGVLVVGSTISTEDAVVPRYYTGSGAPAIACMAGRDYYLDTGAQDIYYCRAANTWQGVARAGGGGGGGGGAGTVTSVAISAPAEFTVGGSPITGAGTLSLTKTSQTTNTIYAGPGSGGAAAPGFRSLVAADIPALDASKVTTGAVALARGGTNQSSWTASRCVQVNAAGTALESATAACGSGGGGGGMSSWLVATPAVGVGASLTTFTFASGGAQTPFSATAGARRNVVPSGGTVSNCYVRTSGAQPATGGLTLTMRKNGTGTTMIIPIAASAAAGAFSNTSATFTLAAGDELEWEAVNAATGTSAVIVSLACMVQ